MRQKQWPNETTIQKYNKNRPNLLNISTSKWTNVKKKPRNSLEISGKPKTINNRQLLTECFSTTVNRFAVLDNENQQVSNNNNLLESKHTKLPLIYIDKVSNIIKLLDDTVKKEYEIEILRAEGVKIQSKTTQTYTIIIT